MREVSLGALLTLTLLESGQSVAASPPGREKTGSSTLQTHQYPILLLPWLWSSSRWKSTAESTRNSIDPACVLPHDNHRRAAHLTLKASLPSYWPWF